MPTARFPSRAWAEEIGFHHDEVPRVVCDWRYYPAGLTGYLMQYWMSAVDLSAHIGGKAAALLAGIHSSSHF